MSTLQLNTTMTGFDYSQSKIYIRFYDKTGDFTEGAAVDLLIKTKDGRQLVNKQYLALEAIQNVYYTADKNKVWYEFEVLQTDFLEDTAFLPNSYFEVSIKKANEQSYSEPVTYYLTAHNELSLNQEGGNSILNSAIDCVHGLKVRGVLAFDADAYCADKLFWYTVQLYSNEICITRTRERIYPTELNTVTYSFDSANFTGENNSYQIVITYGTKFGYINQRSFGFTKSDSVQPYTISLVSTKPNHSTGTITLEYDSPLVENTQLYRTNLLTGQNELFVTVKEPTTEIEDKSAAFGVPYEYNGVGPEILTTDDIHLTTLADTVVVKFNPKITALKRNVKDIITPTLGGEYPFTRRNGQQRYRTFNIEGLISCYQSYDSAEGARAAMEIGDYYNNNPVLKEVVIEKIFRDKITDFLYRDQVILFKSMTEGNIFIRLSNVSLTPNQQLGRRIYTFSAQATEVCEANGENYNKYFTPLDKVELTTLVLYTTESITAEGVMNETGKVDEAIELNERSYESPAVALTQETTTE